MNALSVATDVVIALLLVATIIYASVLNRKLTTLRNTKQEMEALVKADAARTLPGTLPMPDVAALRLKVAQALNNLDAAEVRFDVGLLTTAEMNNAYFAVLKLLVN